MSGKSLFAGQTEGAAILCKPAEIVGIVSAAPNPAGLVLLLIVTAFVTAVLPYLLYTVGLSHMRASGQQPRDDHHRRKAGRRADAGHQHTAPEGHSSAQQLPTGDLLPEANRGHQHHPDGRSVQ